MKEALASSDIRMPLTCGTTPSLDIREDGLRKLLLAVGPRKLGTPVAKFPEDTDVSSWKEVLLGEVRTSEIIDTKLAG